MYSHLLHMFVSCDSQESEPKYQAQMFKGLEDRDLDYSICKVPNAGLQNHWDIKCLSQKLMTTFYTLSGKSIENW